MSLFYYLLIMSFVIIVRRVHMCKSDRFKIESVFFRFLKCPCFGALCFSNFIFW